MDMGLSEIQQMLKNSAREFLAQECPLTLVREMEEDAQGFTEGLWASDNQSRLDGHPLPGAIRRHRRFFPGSGGTGGRDGPVVVAGAVFSPR